MNTMTLMLPALDCPNCAMKIEAKVSKLKAVKQASLAFVSKKLEVELLDNADNDAVYADIVKIVKKLEPDVDVIFLNEKVQEKTPTHNHNCTDCHCADECDHKHVENNDSDTKIMLARIILAVVLFASSFFLDNEKIATVVLVLAYLIVGFDVLLGAVRNIIRLQAFDETLLMTIATVGAFAVGEHTEGVAVMLFFQIGEMFQNIAVNRSRKSITSLMKLKPESVNLVVDGKTVTASPEEIKIGDVFVVRAGEKIACDGEIISGETTLDTSAITGESVPREAGLGSEILSGCINLSGVIEVRATKEFSNSTVAKILEMVENSASKKANAEKFITKFSRVYTPIVVITALVLAFVPPMLLGFSANFSEWLYRGLIFLVISCPCALVISVPLSFFAGIGGAAKSGILIKGAGTLETLAKTTAVAFDKTGTITKGSFKVTRVEPTEKFSEQELLKIASGAEKNSTHPIAVSIVKEAGDDDSLLATECVEIAGQGTSALVNGKRVLVGNKRLLEENNVNVPSITSQLTYVLVAVDGEFAGIIYLGDELKKTAKDAVEALKRLSIEQIVMLTGDRKGSAEETAKAVGITDVRSELLPDGKVYEIEKLLEQSSGKLVFCGDGINDAPVLARADIGFAMGGLGSDAAIEAADAVIMNDEPERVASAIRISRRTLRIVKQNITFALGVKLVVLILGAIGHATMWEAVFADVGVSFIAILNSLRALKKDN